MSEEPTNPGGNTDDEEFMEIEWEVLEAAVDAMADAGLDLADHERSIEHLAVLLASLLRRIRTEHQDFNEEDISELAAEVAAMAVELALGEEQLPPFEASED